MQKTMVITGGTDGIGRAVAEHYLRAGWRVVIVGRNNEKGQQFLAYAKTINARKSAQFIQADLSRLSEIKGAIERIKESYDRIDALVLCAQYYNTQRHITTDGLEHTFALYYLSRYLFSYKLLSLLKAADNPIVLNVCGVGIPMGRIAWDDLQAKNNYQGLEAIMQGSRLNDLLGVSFTNKALTQDVKYVLFNPAGVSTSFSGDYDEAMKLQIETAKRTATPVLEGIKPIIAIISNPPVDRLSALMANDALSVDKLALSSQKANQLDEISKEIIERHNVQV